MSEWVGQVVGVAGVEARCQALMAALNDVMCFLEVSGRVAGGGAGRGVGAGVEAWLLMAAVEELASMPNTQPLSPA